MVVWWSIKVRSRASVSLCRPVFIFVVVVDPDWIDEATIHLNETGKGNPFHLPDIVFC